MVEHAAVNRVVVGSSPTSGASFIGDFDNSCSPDTLLTQNKALFDQVDVSKWPKPVKYRKKILAMIYRPGKARPSYRVAWTVGGKRQMKSFPTYSGEHGAKKFAEDLVAGIAKGSHAPLLTSKQALEAFNIIDLRAEYKQASGRRVSLVEAVSAFIAASKLLPENASLTEAVRVFAQTQVTVKPKLITDAVSVSFYRARAWNPSRVNAPASLPSMRATSRAG